MESSLIRQVSFHLRRFRRPIAAALAFLAVLCAMAAMRPPSPPTVNVVAAADDLAAGTEVRAADVTLVAVPEAYAPPGALATADAVIGRMLSAPMRAGEIITDARLVDTGALGAEGALAVPVRLADADVASLLAPGMRLDIVRAVRGGSPEIVAEDVRVITVPRRSTGFGSSAESAAGSLLLVAADRLTAIRLAAAGTQGGLTAILR